MAKGAEGKGIERFNLRAQQARDVLGAGLETTAGEFGTLRGQLGERFGGQRRQTEAGFDPFIRAGTTALQNVQQGGTVGGLDRTIQEILGSGSFQGLRDQQRQDLLFQQTGSGLRRGDSLEQFANLSPELAFSLENRLFGRNRDLANVGFQGVERRGALGNQSVQAQSGIDAQLAQQLGLFRGDVTQQQANILGGQGEVESQSFFNQANRERAEAAARNEFIGQLAGVAANVFVPGSGGFVSAGVSTGLNTF